MDAQQQIFGLMAATEDLQKQTAAAIAGLAAERAAIARERAALAAAAQDIQKTVSDAVRGALAGAGSAAAVAVSDACQPAIAQLTRVSLAAGGLEDKLNSAANGLSLRLGVGAVVAVVAVVGAGWGSAAWYRADAEATIRQREAARGEIARMEQSIAMLSERGGRAQVATCGNPARRCIRVDPAAGKFTNDYYVIKGY